MSSIDKQNLKKFSVGPVPLILWTIEWLGIRRILSEHLPEHGNSKISPVDTLILIMVNIILGRDPLYKLQRWMEKYDTQCFKISRRSNKFLNDDRFGRELDKLYDADRASLLTDIVVNMITVVKLILDQIHNDSTTQKAFGKIRGKTKNGLELKKGHSKEHRFDLKQLLLSLSVSADGAVPIHYKAYPGNRTDDTTHIETWTTLRKIIGKADFLYVADCKVCTNKQLKYITGNGGRVVTIVPETWTAGKELKEELRDGKKKAKKVIWKKKIPHLFNQWDYYSLFAGKHKTKAGYSVYWFYSTEKKRRDRQSREDSMNEAEEKLVDLIPRMNKRNLKTKEQIEEAVKKILNKHGVIRFYHWKISTAQEQSEVQIGKGRPGPNTKYKTIIDTIYTLSWARNKGELAREKNADGVFPLLSTDENLGAKDVLLAYKYQPLIEKRFTHYRSELKAGPLLFKKIERVDAIKFLYFLGLMVQAVIEREVRRKMKKRKIKALPIYPEDRYAESPTTFRLLDYFEGISVYQLKEGNKVIRWFKDDLNDTQKTILRLLGMKEADYWRYCSAQ